MKNVMSMFLKTRPSIMRDIIREFSLDKKLLEGKQCFEALSQSKSLDDFCAIYNSVEKYSLHHDVEMELDCFSEPQKYIPVAIEKYFKNFFKSETLPTGMLEQMVTCVFQLRKIIENIYEEKPFLYEALIIESMFLLNEIEYYYKHDFEENICYINSIFSYVFQCYSIDMFREIFSKLKDQHKYDIMKTVSYGIENIGTYTIGKELSVLRFLFPLQIFMGFFLPQRNILHRIKKYILINYKYLQKNGMLNIDMEESFFNVLKDIEKIQKGNF